MDTIADLKRELACLKRQEYLLGEEVKKKQTEIQAKCPHTVLLAEKRDERGTPETPTLCNCCGKIMILQSKDLADRAANGKRDIWLDREKFDAKVEEYKKNGPPY